MRVLISGIAEYSRYSEPGEITLVDLNEVIKEVINDLEITIAEKHAKIECDMLPTIEALRIQMHQLFMNLISNAIKYARNDSQPEINMTMSEEEVYVEIKAKDNGIGFDNNYADKDFQPFRRLHTEQVYDGTGIGLTICKKIVEAHGGEIQVHSTKGEGSEFILKLPKSMSADSDD